MRLLLDTHAALWWLDGDARFGRSAARALTDEANQVLLSAAVVWEVAVKRSLGRLEAPDDLAPTLLRAGARPLPVTLAHAAGVERCRGIIATRSTACWSPRPSSRGPGSCPAMMRCAPTASRSSGSSGGAHSGGDTSR